jgi:hypothetical protein
MAGSFTSRPTRTSSRSAYESDRTLIVFGRVGARITVEDETVLLQGYTQEFADLGRAIQRSVSAWAVSEKRSVAIENEQSSLGEEGVWRCPCYPYAGCLSASVSE